MFKINRAKINEQRNNQLHKVEDFSILPYKLKQQQQNQ